MRKFLFCLLFVSLFMIPLNGSKNTTDFIYLTGGNLLDVTQGKIIPNSLVIIKGDRLLGSFTKYSEAYEADLEQLGNQPFLIKHVVKGEDIDRAPALVLGLLNASI